MLMGISGFFLILAASMPAVAQQDWEGGKIIEEVVPKGFRLLRPKNLLDKLHARRGKTYSVQQRDEDVKSLYETHHFEDVRISIEAGSTPNHIRVVITVREASVIQDVIITGLRAIPLSQIKPKLRLNPGDRYNDHLHKLDYETLREEYLSKGYAFSEVTSELVPKEGGVDLHWRVTEGPMVSVRELLFTGNASIPTSTLKQFLLTKENSTFLFIPAGKEPFVRRYLEEDLKRIKLYYQLEGWLDIGDSQRVFVEDLLFSEDKTEVTIKIHIDEGKRYVIRKVEFRGVTGKVPDVTPETLRDLITLKQGQEYSDRVAGEDVKKIRDKYGEKAFILAEVNQFYTVDLEKYELDLIFEVRENNEIRVGRITVTGNYKTRHDVILRELKDFTPGDKFNNRLLHRGVLRLRDRGYFEAGPTGVVVRLEEGEAADIRDVILDVKEGPTGNIRFAGGYSSSFGILGILELTQKNFDITDMPTSIDDFLNGNAFAGGGQFFSLKLSPSAKRQSIQVQFREPYLFGYEYGLGLRGYNTRTKREDWEEARLGGSIYLDKRISDFKVELGINAFRIKVDEVETGAPSSVQSLDGTNRVVSLTPSITYDTRDSVLLPSEGIKLSLAYEHAGDFLPGDFDYWKATFDGDYYITVLEMDERLKHVVQFHARVERMDELDGSDSVPFFERAYAGGRDSIRGFEFRGMGPHEGGDPVGGEAYVYGSIEYSLPLFVEFLRAAVFYDVAALAPEWEDLKDEKFRNTIGFGIRFMIPQLGNVPVALDFGFPLTKRDDDERQTMTFDIGKLF